MNRIRVMVVDDSQEVREYLEKGLGKEEDIDVVSTASSGTQAVAIALKTKPDIVLMDIQMETRTAGIIASSQILKALPETKVIILTILEDDELLFQAYCGGVIDYIIKTDSLERIVTSIHNAYENQLILRPQIAKKIIAELNRVKNEPRNMQFSLSVLSKLSNSEFEVLKCVYEGMTMREISELRFVSEGTVKTQIHSILKKFGKKNMKEVTKKLDEMDFKSFLASEKEWD